MNIKEIIKQHLEENGYDGLFCEEIGCGCELNDLFPCDFHNADCQPGYKRPCKIDPDAVDVDCECDWIIGPEKCQP